MSPDNQTNACVSRYEIVSEREKEKERQQERERASEIFLCGNWNRSIRYEARAVCVHALWQRLCVRTAHEIFVYNVLE